MNNCVRWPEKSLPVWAVLLASGFICLPLEASEGAFGVILPSHFYQTTGFFVLCAGLLALLAIGGWRWAQRWRARALQERDAEVFKLVDQWTKSLQQEVAERKDAQRALQDSQELIMRQERLAAVGQLAAGLAHEFNNILTIIQGHASLLLDNPALDEDAINSVTHISDGVERTAKLIKQMLAFSRKQVMQRRVLHIKETMEAITDMLGQLLGEHVVLRFEMGPRLPPIMADPEMLQQIIVNLVVNARDAMSSGGQLTICASDVKFTAAELAGKPDRRAGHFLQLSVSDTGAGMDTAIINHLFEPFFTTKDIGKGCGLGLATVYGMVNQHEGWIEVESKVGQGATFNIYFPATENAPVKPEETPTAPEVRGGKEIILVVEDEHVLRELVREILEAHGYGILEAANGLEALHQWEKSGMKVDLLLTDMAMPHGISGRDLAAKLQKEKPLLPVIFSSGYSQEALERHEETLPGQTFLSKPYRPAELAQAVRAALDKAGQIEKSKLADCEPARPL
ncbi:MAG TPA: response regulator [Candidatus Saccharimonadales bacterium]|nr:response regulator [Candidatus Saccharimonadales bacterium]